MQSSFFVVLKKEFAGYFRTPTAFIIIGVYLILSMVSTFYSASFFNYDNSGLISFFSHQPEILTILMPAVTMRLWADEYRSGTIEFLLAKPISYKAVVLGKFGASCLFGWLMLLLTLPFAFNVSFLVSMDVRNVLSAYIATAFVIALLSAVGCLVSVFNSNAVLAYLFSVFLGWVITIWDFNFILVPIEGISPSIMNALNFYPNYQDMLMGQPGVDNIVYFVSLILLILWLNIVAIDYKKR